MWPKPGVLLYVPYTLVGILGGGGLAITITTPGYSLRGVWVTAAGLALVLVWVALVDIYGHYMLDDDSAFPPRLIMPMKLVRTGEYPFDDDDDVLQAELGWPDPAKEKRQIVPHRPALANDGAPDTPKPREPSAEAPW
jgi:hypothetical protein